MTDTLVSQLGKLKGLRCERGVKQGVLAAHLDIEQCTYLAYENHPELSAKRMRYGQLVTICNLLDASPEDFFHAGRELGQTKREGSESGDAGRVRLSLREARISSGKTCNEMAVSCNVIKTTVLSWEANPARMRLCDVESCLACLDFGIEQIDFTRADPEPKKRAKKADTNQRARAEVMEVHDAKTPETDTSNVRVVA